MVKNVVSFILSSMILSKNVNFLSSPFRWVRRNDMI